MNNLDIESGPILKVLQLTQGDGQSSREKAKETTVAGKEVQRPRILRLWKRKRLNLSQPDIPRQCSGGVAQLGHQDEATNAPVRQIPSRYTSNAFDKLPIPMPVCNVNRSARTVIIMRLGMQLSNFCLMITIMLYGCIYFVIMVSYSLKS